MLLPFVFTVGYFNIHCDGYVEVLQFLLQINKLARFVLQSAKQHSKNTKILGYNPYAPVFSCVRYDYRLN